MDGAAQPDPRLGHGALRRLLSSPGLGDAVWLWLLLRVGLGVLALFFWAQMPIAIPCHFELGMQGWGPPPPLAGQMPEFPLVGVWQHWDACWYSKIAYFGYQPGTDSANFWPLTPMAMRLVSVLLGGDVALGGLVVAGVAYVIAIAGLFRLVAHDFDEPLARRTAVFISVAPAALFLFAPFTEAPFLAATVWAVLAARERRWWLAALAAFLAGLTRIQGIVLVLPLAWEAFSAWRERWAATRSTADGPDALAPARGPMPLPALGSVVAIAAPAVAFGSFLAYANAVMGTTPLQTQAIWGGTSFHPPWEVVDAALRWAVDRHDALEALNLFALLLFIAAVVAGLRMLPLSYSLLAAPQVALLAVRIQPTPLTSTTRLVEVVFPAFVVFAIWMNGRRREVSWTVLSTMLLAALVWLFVKGDWVA